MLSMLSSVRLMSSAQISHILLLEMRLPHLGFLTSQGQTSVLTGLAF